MDALSNLLYGFSVGLQPVNIFFCFLGVLMGTLVGVLPGIGPVGAMSILLPVTFRMSPVSAVIMLAGIYYGSQYGGSTTSILVNIPGESASIVTCLDGYQMAKQGRAGPALGIAAFGSFIAGTCGIVGLVIFAQPLSEFGLKFGPPEFLSVVVLGLCLVTYLSSGSKIKALMTAIFGLILSCIGIDQINASPRMTFNVMQLWDGIDIVSVAMGLFGISEIIMNVEEATDTTDVLKTKIGSFFPTRSDWKKSFWPIVRGTIGGFFLGVLPGSGPTISSFGSYAVEKRLSKTPEQFGKGAVEGVAGPESANNAAAAGNFIPLLTLGIPPNAMMALLFGALLIHGMRPGPLLVKEHPDIFWGVISSMYMGNVMLLILNLPLIPIWVKVLKVPYRILFPLILLFCLIGAYSVRNDGFGVLVMLIFGIVGYLFKKFDYPGAPLLLGFILGPLFEVNLRQSLLLSKGSFSIFFSRPISAVGVSLAIILFAASILPEIFKSKKA